MKLSIDKKCLTFSDGWRIVYNPRYNAFPNSADVHLLKRGEKTKALSPRYQNTVWSPHDEVLCGWDEFLEYQGPVLVKHVILSAFHSLSPEDHRELQGGFQY